MIDDFVGISDLSQGLAFVTLLAARFLARTFAQAAHPRRFLQSIARRRFTAVRTVQSKLALKFGYPRFQSRDQRNQLFPRWLGWRIRVHRILESNPDSDVQKNLRARLRQTAYPTWAETEKLIESCKRAFKDGPPIAKTRLKWRKADIAIGKSGVEATERPGAELPVVLDEADIELPDLLTDLQDRTQLTRRTIFKAIAVGDNPARFKKAKKLDDLVADS
jgi:hypothetical protein